LADPAGHYLLPQVKSPELHRALFTGHGQAPIARELDRADLAPVRERHPRLVTGAEVNQIHLALVGARGKRAAIIGHAPALKPRITCARERPGRRRYARSNAPDLKPS